MTYKPKRKRGVPASATRRRVYTAVVLIIELAVFLLAAWANGVSVIHAVIWLVMVGSFTGTLFLIPLYVARTIAESWLYGAPARKRKLKLKRTHGG